MNETASLPDHLYTKGLLGGRHSDIAIIAFGHQYNLHRIILDRAPFFSTALSEPWLESTAKEVPLHPEEIDSNITQTAFELALKRLYGCGVAEEEDAEAIGLFATGCWLEMQDLVESSIDSILRQMGSDNLAPLIRLVTNNYYGRAGERILSSAKAMLCRDGWEMPSRYWDGIPGDIVREIVGGDGFFISGEWDRWLLAKKVLDRRLKQRATEAGLINQDSKTKVQAPESLAFMAVRFDGVYRQNAITAGRGTPDSHHPWLALYTHPDIEPILVLLDEGIHYIHLDFEQLQYIRSSRDVLGLPVMPERVITNALWMGMELRQKVLNCRDLDLELGLSRPAEQPSAPTPTPTPSKGKNKAGDSTTVAKMEDYEDMDSGSWDANGRPRKFWIPSTDCNIVMGGNAEPVVTTSHATQAFQRHASRMSATLQPEDVQWATDFGSSPSNNAEPGARPTPPPLGRTTAAGEEGQPGSIAYSHFPPFRFATEFPNPRGLKERKRVYSRTVFYAGSLWNVYIQKVRSVKNPQLGVYLHRAKEREADEVTASTLSSTGVATVGSTAGSVDERIGLLEREMLLRSEQRRERRHRRATAAAAEVPERVASRTLNTTPLALDQNDSNNNTAAVDAGADSSGSAGDVEQQQRRLDSRNSGLAALNRRQRLETSLDNNDGGQQLLLGTVPMPLHPADWESEASTDDDDEDADFIAPSGAGGRPSYQQDRGMSSSAAAGAGAGVGRQHNQNLNQRQHQHQHHYRAASTAAAAAALAPRTPTVPLYVDARPTIKTYFKIYSPSKGGRLLSVYESAPDQFNFSQSWGWKSSTLMLDEGMNNGGEDGGVGGAAAAGIVGAGGEDGGGAAAGLGRRRSGAGGSRAEGKLRFMVVIGNL